MREQRLLERIRSYAKNPDKRGAVDPNVVVKSIHKHAQHILNTRKGSVPIDPDYGVPDFTDIAGSYASDTVQEMQQNINELLLKYEPRLKDVRVEFEPQDNDILSLKFRIRGALDMDGSDIPVIFESVVQSDGKITVEG